MSRGSHDNSEYYIVPSKDGGRLRACLQCKLIKSSDQWRDGCDNCGGSVEVYGTADRWTTPSFTGICALMDDNKSWVAKHQRVTRLIPGLYAIAVKGSLSKRDDDDGDIDE